MEFKISVNIDTLDFCIAAEDGDFSKSVIDYDINEKVIELHKPDPNFSREFGTYDLFVFMENNKSIFQFELSEMFSFCKSHFIQWRYEEAILLSYDENDKASDISELLKSDIWNNLKMIFDHQLDLAAKGVFQ